MKEIEILGARENNLKNISLSLPKNELICLIGPSGSGKTSLAFDTLLKESQRRLTLLGYTQIDKFNQPEVSSIRNLPVVISVQPNSANDGATLADMLGLTRELLQQNASSFKRCCPNCMRPVSEISDLDLKAVIKNALETEVEVIAICLEKLTEDKESLSDLVKLGYTRCYIDSELRNLDSLEEVDFPISLDLVLDRLDSKSTNNSLVEDSIKQALATGFKIKLRNYQTGSLIHNVQTEKKCEFCGAEIFGDLRIKNLAALRSLDILKSYILSQDYTLFDLFTAEVETLKPKSLPNIAQRAVELLKKLNLAHLSLSRKLSTLSLGERIRTQIGKSIFLNSQNLLYILESPSLGLHYTELDDLMKMLTEVKLMPNTVILIDQNEEVINRCGRRIELGPNGGTHGGELVSTNSNKVNTLDSFDLVKSRMMNFQNFIQIKDASAGNIKNLSLKIPIGAISAICGRSGSGKSNLLRKILYEGVVADLDCVKSDLKFSRITADWADNVSNSPYAIVASYSKILPELRKLFALLPEAKARGFKPNTFSLTSSSGMRCKACKGTGIIEKERVNYSTLVEQCSHCSGYLFEPAIRNVRFKGFSFSELLKLDIYEFSTLFQKIPAIHKRCENLKCLNLGHLVLSQKISSLSLGESKRIRICEDLSFKHANHLYLLDRPSAGLSRSEKGKMIKVLRRLAASGNTIVMVEHDLEMIYASDYSIEMGPGAGVFGGKVTFEGSTNELATKADSLTGAEILKRIKS